MNFLIDYLDFSPFLRRKTFRNIVLYTLFIFAFLLLDNNLFAANTDEANRDFVEGDYETALKLYESELGNKPNDAKLLLNIGNTYYRMSKYSNAVEYYNKAIKELTPLEDKNIALLAEAYHNLGNANVMMKSYQEGLMFYKESLRIYPLEYKTKYNYNLVKQLLNQMNQQNKQKEDDKEESKQSRSDSKQNKENKPDKQDKNNNNEPNQSKEQNKDEKGNKNNKDNKEGNKNQSMSSNEKDNKEMTSSKQQLSNVVVKKNDRKLSNEDTQYLDSLTFEENKHKQKMMGIQNQHSWDKHNEKDW